MIVGGSSGAGADLAGDGGGLDVLDAAGALATWSQADDRAELGQVLRVPGLEDAPGLLQRIKELVAENNKLQEENDTLARIINVLEVENHGLHAGTGRTGQLVALPSANHR